MTIFLASRNNNAAAPDKLIKLSSLFRFEWHLIIPVNNWGNYQLIVLC